MNPIQAEMDTGTPVVSASTGGNSWYTGLGDVFSGLAGAALQFQQLETEKEIAMAGAGVHQQTNTVETQQRQVVETEKPVTAAGGAGGLSQKTMLIAGGAALLVVAVLVVGMKR